MASTVMHALRAYTNNNICRGCNLLLHFKIVSKGQFCRSIHASKYLKDREKDPSPIFFEPSVQDLLTKLTRVDLKKVYRKRRDEEKLDPPEYKFMTTEELNLALKEAEENAQHRLQMPPVVLPRMEIERTWSKDPALKGLEKAKHVFTDITYGIPDRERIVIVRDPDGTLRDASWEERFRMNQIYFPVAGRHLQRPKMFEKENLKRLLAEEEYEFILNCATVQFEPDDPDYISIVTATYEHADDSRKYEALRSTRHFGPLVFHLAWNKRIDNLLLDIIHFERIDEAVPLIKLYHKINPEAKSASVEHSDDMAFIKSYIELDSNKRGSLELAIQTYLELLKQKQDLEEGIQRAHGHQ